MRCLLLPSPLLPTGVTLIDPWLLKLNMVLSYP